MQEKLENSISLRAINNPDTFLNQRHLYSFAVLIPLKRKKTSSGLEKFDSGTPVMLLFLIALSYLQ